MLWLPMESELVLNVQEPPERVHVPMLVPPSLKVAVPEGVPKPGATAATVAVNVTDWPKVDGVTPPLVLTDDGVWAVPSIVKVTLPVGLAAALLPGAVTLTVAVNVTDWPNTEGFTDDATESDVSALFTVWPPLKLAELLALKLPSPL